MRSLAVSAATILLLTGSALGDDKASSFDKEALKKLEKLVSDAATKKKIPGGVLWIDHRGKHYAKAFGARSVTPKREKMTADTAFDLASLTKVVATAPSILILQQRNKLSINHKVSQYIPEFKGGGREKITIKQLLTHTSGCAAGIARDPAWKGYSTAIKLACGTDLKAKPGRNWRYSDINYILLGEIVRRVSGMTLDRFARKEIFAPLKMFNTGFLPPPDKKGRIAPTTKTRGVVLRGVVHDPTARRMGGVAGHAGLFSTAADVSRYARMILNGGTLDGVRVLYPKSVQEMTRNQTTWRVREKRGLGWDIDSRYSYPRGEHFPKGASFGHTGWTGTSMWLDPASKTAVIFLANRNHPYERRSIRDLRSDIATLAAESVGLGASE